MTARDGEPAPQPGEDPVAFFGSIADGPWSATEHAGNRLARALVALSTRALSVNTTDDEVAELALRLEALIGSAARGPATRYRPEDRPDRRSVRPNATGKHPIAGPVNPVAPPIVLRRDADRAHGDVIYDLRFEGLPGLVQGGFIAAAFDLMLGQAVALSGKGGMTGSLCVRYLSPTPLYESLRYTSWFERAEGRKTYAHGKLIVVATGRVCATAEGVFIAPKNGLPGSVD